MWSSCISEGDQVLAGGSSRVRGLDRHDDMTGLRGASRVDGEIQGKEGSGTERMGSKARLGKT